MSRYLRFFTTVGDDPQDSSEWKDEELHVSTEELEPAAGQQSAQLTFRQSLCWLYSSQRFQIAVVCLIILDAIFVLCELLIDLTIIKADHGKIAPQVFHYLSLALLTFFMVELSGKIYAFRLDFFKHKFEVFDGVVVVVSFILDIVYISREDAFDGVGFLILLRLWRVARIVNGILVSVQNRANNKIQRLKESNAHLVQRVSELQEQTTKMEQENSRLRALLQQHSIEF